jgi:hypothetical protein
VYAQAAVHARAAEADEDAELGRGPLRGRRVAVAAEVVVGFFLDGEELLGEMVVSFAYESKRTDGMP